MNESSLFVTVELRHQNDYDHWLQAIYTAAIVSILCTLIATIIIGNSLVIAAVLIDRHLKKKPQNYLIVSLAFADIAVGIAVLPLSAAHEAVGHRWIFGPMLCEVWICADVAACSASILSMVGIAIDRYKAVNSVYYCQHRKKRSILLMIGCVWTLSLMISLLPVITGWKDQDYDSRIEQQVCMVSQELSYQIFSSTLTFYIPVTVVVTLYICIYRAAKKRINRRYSSVCSTTQPSPTNNFPKTECGTEPDAAFSTPPSVHNAHTIPCSKPLPAALLRLIGEAKAANQMPMNNGLPPRHSSLPTTPAKEVESERTSSEPSSRKPSAVGRLLEFSKTAISLETLSNMKAFDALVQQSPQLRRSKRTLSLELKRERKAFQTLAIVTGAFVVCWAPFFATALIRPLCNVCINDTISAICIWLGWCNSLCNPIIYTVFSPDYRSAFKKLLLKMLATFRCVYCGTIQPAKIQTLVETVAVRQTPSPRLSRRPSPPKILIFGASPMHSVSSPQLL